MIKRNVQFLNLGEDILYLVATQLRTDSPSSMLNLAKTSKKCHGLAIPFLYRSIELDEHPHTSQLISRLLDKKDAIHNHVREITVSNSGKDEFEMDESQLLHIISNVKQLQMFR
jgi:hypothetical protein